MRVAIAGGHGKIALLLTGQLAARGDDVVSLIRNAGHGEEVGEAGAEPLVCDLESASCDEVAEGIRGCDAVVFAAGAGPGSGPERKETMDYGGAVKLIAAARAARVGRYVMVSAISADPEHEGDEVMDIYVRAKGRADAELAQSGLDYTIVRPGPLTDEPGTGRVAVGDDLDRAEISREDVASVVAAALAMPDETVGATFDLVGGDVPVEEAVRGLR